MQPEAKHRRNYPKVLLNRESHVNGSCKTPPKVSFSSIFFSSFDTTLTLRHTCVAPQKEKKSIYTCLCKWVEIAPPSLLLQTNWSKSPFTMNLSVCLSITYVCMCVCDILDDNNNNPLYNREKNIGEFVENMLLFIEKKTKT